MPDDTTGIFEARELLATPPGTFVSEFRYSQELSVPVTYRVYVPDDEVRYDYLLVNFHAMVDRAKIVPPMFARERSSRRFEAVTLFIADPTLAFSSQMRTGWFLALEPASDVLLKLACGLVAQYGLKGVVWNGSSAGGYAAIRYAQRCVVPSLGFAYAPQNLPENLSWWTTNYLRNLPVTLSNNPYFDSDYCALPHSLADCLISASRSPNTFHVVTVNDNDHGHIRDHCWPIYTATIGHANVSMNIIRNGLGHGEEGSDRYWRACESAVSRWEKWKLGGEAA